MALLTNTRLVFLGTSSATPTVERGLSSLAVIRGSELLLFDAGEGMQRNFIKAGLGMNRKMKVFVTHMHSDHCVGLLGLMQTMSLQGRERDLDIYGEPRVAEFLKENMRIINFGLTFDVKIHTISNEGIVAKDSDYQVLCCQSDHTVLSYSYCIQEFDRPGTFDIIKANELGLPEGELYRKLQHGEDVVYAGRLVRSSDIMGPARPGRKIGISGDTRPTKKLLEFFRLCDVLVFESTYSHEKQEKAIETGHSTANEAAALAKNAGVKKLLLTHFSARYAETSILVREASRIHEAVEAAYDLMTIDVPYN